MIKLIFYFKNIYSWLSELFSETDLKQLLLCVMLILMLFYIASILSGWLSIACYVIAVLYGSYILEQNFGHKLIDMLRKKEKEEQED